MIKGSWPKRPYVETLEYERMDELAALSEDSEGAWLQEDTLVPTAITVRHQIAAAAADHGAVHSTVVRVLPS